jgi:hypothetical protein
VADFVPIFPSSDLLFIIHTDIDFTAFFIFGNICSGYVTIREEHRLRVFENRVLRRIFGLKRDEMTGEWRKMHKEELRDLYSSQSIIRIIKSRRMRWAGHVA